MSERITEAKAREWESVWRQPKPQEGGDPDALAILADWRRLRGLILASKEQGPGDYGYSMSDELLTEADAIETEALAAKQAACPHQWTDMHATECVTGRPFTYRFCPACGLDTCLADTEAVRRAAKEE